MDRKRKKQKRKTWRRRRQGAASRRSAPLAARGRRVQKRAFTQGCEWGWVRGGLRARARARRSRHTLKRVCANLRDATKLIRHASESAKTGRPNYQTAFLRFIATSPFLLLPNRCFLGVIACLPEIFFIFRTSLFFTTCVARDRAPVVLRIGSFSLIFIIFRAEMNRETALPLHAFGGLT